MVAIACPHCNKPDAVIKFGTNRCGTQKLRCKTCSKVFTPQPKPWIITPEVEERILAALAERLSQRAVARLLQVSRTTVAAVLKKRGNPLLP